MKKVYRIKAELVDGDRGLYAGEKILHMIYTEKATAKEIAMQEALRIAETPCWWMGYAKNPMHEDLPLVEVELVEVEGL